MDQLLSLSWWLSMFGQTWGWWLACEVIALVVLPLALRWFRSLPDRGIGLAPALGVLLVTYTAWVWSFIHSALAILVFLLIAALLVALGFWLEGQGHSRWRFGCFGLSVPFILACIPWVHRGPVIAAAVVVWAGVGAAFWWEDWRALWRIARRRWVYWLAVQILFTAGFLFFSNVRSYIPWASYEPGMSGAEKFDNLAHLNSCMRADHMPPEDVWWAGKTINYYYGGHLITATVAKLTGQPAAIAFNLGLAMVFALTLTSGFSLTFNIVNRVARLWRPQWAPGWRRCRSSLWVKGMGWGLLGAVAIAMFGNLDSWTQVLSRDMNAVRPSYERIYSNQIKQWMDWEKDLKDAREDKDKKRIERLEDHPEGVPPTSQLSAVQLRFSWPNLLNVDFWRSSRMIKGSITEFPYFSAILGDHHAHHYALPFSMVALAAVAGLLRRGARWKSRRTVVRWLGVAWPELLAMAFLIGAILPINAWDVVVLIPLYFLAVLLAMTRLAPERQWRWVTTAAAYGIGMIALALLLNSRTGMLKVIQDKITLVIPVVLAAIPVVIEELRPGTLKLWMRTAFLAVGLLVLSMAAAVSGQISASDVSLILVVVGAVSLWQLFSDGRLYRWWGATLTVYGLVGVIGLAFGLPFKVYFHSPFDIEEPLLVSLFPPQLAPAVWAAPNFWHAVWARLPVNPTGIAPLRSQLRDYIGHWGIFWIPIIILWVTRLIAVTKRWQRGKGFALWFGLLAVLYITFDLIKNSWVAPITLTMFVGSLVLAFHHKRDTRGAAVWSFLTIAFFYSFFVEVLHFDDQYSGELERYNTPFKIYYPLWPMMAAGMCIMLKELVARRAPRTDRYPRSWWHMSPWVGLLSLAAVVICLAATDLFLPAMCLSIIFAAVLIVSFFVPSLRPQDVPVARVSSDLLTRLAWRVPLLLCVVFLLVLGMLYPIATTAGRTNWFQNPEVIPKFQAEGQEKDTYTTRTLNAMAYLGNKPEFADDYKMIQWINKNISGSPVLVERIGEGAYQPGSRFATNTGLPTLLGWEHHELQWRGWGKAVSDKDLEMYGEPLVSRAAKPGKPPELVRLTGLIREQVDQIYKAPTYDQIKNLLEMHDVEYIVVGSLERTAYKDSPDGLQKFTGPPFEKVHQIGGTTLYKVPE